MKRQKVDYAGDLKKRLAKAGVSHGALARQAGMHKSQLSRMFNKPMQPNLDNVARLEKAFEELTGE